MKNFLITLFVKQNKYHKYSVLGHTIAVTKECIKAKQHKFILAAILHDVGKPVVAYQDSEDIVDKTYSFTGHEEKSYQIIKKIPFISEWTKNIVRHHYLITGMASDLRKAEKATTDSEKEHYLSSHNSRLEIWHSLDESFKEDLMFFKIFDDNGKGIVHKEKALPEFLKPLYETVYERIYPKAYV